MSIKSGDMPAMPQNEAFSVSNDFNSSEDMGGIGLTKREQFAAMVMQGLLSNSVMGDSGLHKNHNEWVKDISEAATEFADALLAKLEEKGDVE